MMRMAQYFSVPRKASRAVWRFCDMIHTSSGVERINTTKHKISSNQEGM